VTYCTNLPTMLCFDSVFHDVYSFNEEVLKMWGAPPGGAVGPFEGGTSCLYEKRIYLDRTWMQDKIYIFW
jgi:hypothetical protein